MDGGAGALRRYLDRRLEVPPAKRRIVSGSRIRADEDSPKVTVKTDLKDISAFRLELLNDPNLPAHGPGRSLKGTLRADRIRSISRAGQ